MLGFLSTTKGRPEQSCHVSVTWIVIQIENNCSKTPPCLQEILLPDLTMSHNSYTGREQEMIFALLSSSKFKFNFLTFSPRRPLNKSALSISLCQKQKSLNFASSSWWHLKVGMETPENDFQIYRPINDPRRAVCSLERGYRWGNIQKSLSGNNFWLECPTNLRSTPLSYIFNALFRDTPLGSFLE